MTAFCVGRVEVTMDRLIGIPEAAQILGIKQQTLYLWIKDPQKGIPFIRLGPNKSVIRFRLTHLDKWLNEHETRIHA